MIPQQSILEMAKILAKQSKCVSMQVGAILVKDNRIISTGINGTPSGTTNCNDIWDERCEDHTKWSNIHEIHAEFNAILFAAKNGISTNGTSLYCTHEPCAQCVKNMIQAGIVEVYYEVEYYNENEELKQSKQDLINESKIIFKKIEKEETI